MNRKPPGPTIAPSGLGCPAPAPTIEGRVSGPPRLVVLGVGGQTRYHGAVSTLSIRPGIVVAVLGLVFGCERTPRTGSPDGTTPDTTDSFDPSDTDAAPDPGDGTFDTSAPDGTADTPDAGDVPQDSDDAEDALSDTSPDGDDTADPTDLGDLPDAVDTTDTLEDAPDTQTVDTAPLPCPAGTPCTLFGWVPPCYEGRCSAAEVCVPTRIADCCVNDSDCIPPATTPACQTSRCVNRTCGLAVEPGCCTDDTSCDDGLAATTDRCLPSARCEHCAPACESPPVLERRFDGPEPLNALGFIVLDPQPNDRVTWQRATARSASGEGAVYLGDPRCRTYYAGALNAACAPVSAEGQDSQRVSPTLLSPYVILPWDVPTVASFLVFSDVEPPLGRGDAEPDVLRVLVESVNIPIWRVASTLELGKSTGWTPVVVDLAPWRGQPVRLRFEFDTLDGQNNLHEGVWLDELVIAPSCANGGCCHTDLDCTATSTCGASRCLETAQGSGRVCVEVPRTLGAPCTTCLADLQCDDLDPCTTDRCVGAGPTPGRCEHTAFCCLERDLLTADFETSLHPLAPDGPDLPETGAVRWHVRDGSAAFSDPLSGTYETASDGRARGSLIGPPVLLPERLNERQTIRLDLTLALSTEWDLSPPGTFDNPAGLDRLTVELLDGALVRPLWTSDTIEGTTRGEALRLSLDLTPWRGRAVSLRFTFDTGDGASNAFSGPRLDDLRVRVVCR